MKCYCDSNFDFKLCCQPLLDGQYKADSPLSLMRSRYTAFALGRFAYLEKTTLPETFKLDLFQRNIQWAQSVRFTKLEILGFTEETRRGRVKFRAYFVHKLTGDSSIHEEDSLFEKVNQTWYFCHPT